MTAAAPFTLTRQQKNFFDTFGYLVIPGLLKDCIEEVSTVFNQLFEHNPEEVVDWRHEAHYMKSRRFLLQFIERRPELSALLEHPIIDGTFQSLLGNDYLYRGSDGNIFTGDTYWHSDLYGAFFKYRHVKILLYLEPLDASNGGFRAIPGSHLFGDKFANLCERYVWKHEQHLGLEKDDVPSVTIPTQPGDVLVFDFRLKHATSNTHSARRMINISASQRFADEDLPKLAEIMQMFLDISGTNSIYHPHFLANANAAQDARTAQCLEALHYLKMENSAAP